jgi:hypothetical protein
MWRPEVGLEKVPATAGEIQHLGATGAVTIPDPGIPPSLLEA